MAGVPARDRRRRRGDHRPHPGVRGHRSDPVARGRGLGHLYPQRTIAEELTKKISALLHEAGETHHVVYRITDGEDDDWASWYSDWLTAHSELPELLGKAPVRSHLTHALVELEREFGAEQGWEDKYAEAVIERFGA